MLQLEQLTEMGIDHEFASWALARGGSVPRALDVLWPQPCTFRNNKSETYVARAQKEFGIRVQVIDLGVTAGPKPRIDSPLIGDF